VIYDNTSNNKTLAASFSKISRANSTNAIKPQEFLKGSTGKFDAFPDAIHPATENLKTL